MKFIILLSVFFTSCIPWYRTYSKIPGVEISVHDDKNNILELAKVYVFLCSYPYGIFSGFHKMILTDEFGVAKFDQVKEGEWVLPLLPHGIREYTIGMFVLKQKRRLEKNI